MLESIGPVTERRHTRQRGTSAASVCSSALLLFHAGAASSCLIRVAYQPSGDDDAPHARLVTRRELVTKIDASTNNPEGNRASGRMDDSILLRPAWLMFHILCTTFVGEKNSSFITVSVHNTVGTELKPRWVCCMA